MQHGPLEILLQLFPLLLTQAALIFGIVPMARASGRRTWLWVLFSLIPIIGGFAYPILLARSVAVVLRRLGTVEVALRDGGLKTAEAASHS